MKRFSLIAALFFLAAGTASADYILIKININQMDFVPGAGGAATGNPGGVTGVPGGAGGVVPGGVGGIRPGGVGGVVPGGMGGIRPGGVGGVMPGGRGGIMPGGRGGVFPGGMGGRPGMQMGGFPPGGMGGVPPGGAAGVVPPGGMVGGIQPPPIGDPKNPGGNPMMEEDPNAKWIYVYVEVKNFAPRAKTPYGDLYACDTKWGTSSWLPYSPYFPYVSPPMQMNTFKKDFDSGFAKASKEKEKSAESFIKLARSALTYSRHVEFHKAMAEAEKINSKHPLVQNYQRVKKELAKPLKADDPLQRDVIADLKKQYYKENVSKNLHKKDVVGHYCLYTPKDGDAHLESSATRRLVMMEETLETFYYWFAVQKEGTPQPNFPRHRLIAVIPGSKESFSTYHLKWGSPSMVADGFTPRRDNVMVLTAKPRFNDPLHAEFEKTLDAKIGKAVDAINKAYKIEITKEDFRNLKAQDVKGAGQGAIFVAFAQTAVLAAKALEDEAERHTISNEGVRQLLVASGMFPRNVPVPQWLVEGLAAFFETPAGGMYPTVGERSMVHLTSFKHLSTKYKDKFDAKEIVNVLQNVVTDGYFAEAQQKSKQALGDRTNKELQKEAKESWEMARCTSWAFIYYLVQKGKLEYLVNYGKELNKLPRDMDLNDMILQGCFAKAFDKGKTRDPRQIDPDKLKNLAIEWIGEMNETNIRPGELQTFLLQLRAMQDGPTDGKAPPPGGGGDPGTKPPVVQPPTPDQPPVIPPPGATDFTGASWTGTELANGQGTKITFQFTDATKVTLTGRAGNLTGTYSIKDKMITMQFDKGISYTGAIGVNQVQGNAKDDRISWTWVISSGVAPAVNPKGNPPPGVGPANPPPGVGPANPPHQPPPQVRPPMPRPVVAPPIRRP